MSSARLTVSLSRLVDNYQLLCARTSSAVGAVVKAEAYGLGAAAVCCALRDSGCKSFFVATISEASALDPLSLPRLYVISGAETEGDVDYFVNSGNTPVLNDLDQAKLWAKSTSRPCAVSVDTGMERLGLSLAECDDPCIQRLNVELLLTHLACADTPDNPQNMNQISLLRSVRHRFPNARTSIGTSAAIFGDPALHGDLCRPGIALYGGNPFSDRENPMQPTATFEGRVIARRIVSSGNPVGYGASYRAKSDIDVAVIGAGYADGVWRHLSNRGFVAFRGQRLPIIGRISMDSVNVDASSRPDLSVGDWVEFFGSTISVDEVSDLVGSISYESLTRVGRRVDRIYQ